MATRTQAATCFTCAHTQASHSTHTTNTQAEYKLGIELPSSNVLHLCAYSSFAQHSHNKHTSRVQVRHRACAKEKERTPKDALSPISPNR